MEVNPMRRWHVTVLLILPLLFLLGSPVAAQGQGAGGPSIGWNGWGVRAGITSEPDQVYAGVHFELGEFARNVRFRPNVEFGSGDDVKLLQASGEVHYVFSKVQVWKPYVGGALAVNFYKLDNAPAGVDDSDTEFGLMGVGGIQTKLKSATSFFLEAKLGLTSDDPDFKVGAGWSWK
jgi:hypothetical protein